MKIRLKVRYEITKSDSQKAQLVDSKGTKDVTDERIVLFEKTGECAVRRTMSTMTKE